MRPLIIKAALASSSASTCSAVSPFVENAGRKRYDLLVAVSAPEETRLARALRRDPSSTRDSVLARMRAQLPDESRNAACDVVIPSTGTVEELRARVDTLAPRLGVRS